MTERKKPGQPWESFIEQQIREAIEASSVAPPALAMRRLVEQTLQRIAQCRDEAEVPPEPGAPGPRRRRAGLAGVAPRLIRAGTFPRKRLGCTPKARHRN